MDSESINNNRTHWNRMLLNSFWLFAMLTLIVEIICSTVSSMSAGDLIYELKSSGLMLLLLLFTESFLRIFKGKFQDYSLIFVSALVAFIVVYVHNSLSYLLLVLFMPVMVSIFYFNIKKLVFALITALAALYVLYWSSHLVNDGITSAGLMTITSIFILYTFVAWGILRRGKELLDNFKAYFESHQQLLVKTIWMDKLSKTDALTDLYNHITFHEYLERLIDQHESNGLQLQLALLDIDNFKRVNDTYGHRAGDAVLKSVSTIIKENASVNDFVARYGGEEFAVLYTDKTSSLALDLVEQIRQTIAAFPQDNLGGKPVTVSVGFGTYRRGEGKEHFFHRVDSALYEAKSSGKNCTVLADAQPPSVEEIQLSLFP